MGGEDGNDTGKVKPCKKRRRTTRPTLERY